MPNSGEQLIIARACVDRCRDDRLVTSLALRDANVAGCSIDVRERGVPQMVE